MSESKIVTVRISRWGQFFELATKMQYRQWFFRGQEDARWHLQTALERDVEDIPSDSPLKAACLLGKDVESRAIESFRAVTGLSGDCSDIEVLSMMQHYGTKTRLLDFSFSIYEALYFAFEDKRKPIERSIFAVNRIALVQNSPAVQKVIKEKFNEDFADLCDEKDLAEESDRYIANSYNDELFQCACFNQIVCAHMSDVDYYERDVVPVILDRPNPRMRAQVGLFLLPLTFGAFNDNLAAVFKDEKVDLKNFETWREDPFASTVSDLSNIGLIRMVFDGGLVASSQQVLSQANVFAHTVYPDLVGYAKGIRCWSV